MKASLLVSSIVILLLGPEPRQVIQTQVLQNLGGKWLIAGFQNTNGVPERPFPQAGAPDRSTGTKR
jgi:hypothetical protein